MFSRVSSWVSRRSAPAVTVLDLRGAQQSCTRACTPTSQQSDSPPPTHTPPAPRHAGMILGDDAPELRRRTAITHSKVQEWLPLAFNPAVSPKAVILQIDCAGRWRAAGGTAARTPCCMRPHRPPGCSSSGLVLVRKKQALAPWGRLVKGRGTVPCTTHPGYARLAGGQPAATEQIYGAIRRAADDAKVPVLACALNVAASGG